MKILIVDDNANNRMVLKLLLEDYAQETENTFEIEECENGLLSVQKAKQSKYNLIFMDIMMPEMDGIEATKKIREIDKEVMIIAVSAVDDDARQKEILRNGAEDYVPKPIDAEQFYSRLENYVPLLLLRDQKKSTRNTKAVNLYTKEIFHRQTIFYVENEEALSEFWEYYLLGDEPLKVDGLSDIIRAVFALGEAIVKVSATPWIIVEADNDMIYITLNKLDAIGDLLVKLIMKKNKEVEEFVIEGDKISFRLEKMISVVAEIEETLKEQDVIQEIPTQEPAQASVEIATTNVSDYRIFNYMDPDDLAEVEELLGDLSSIMLILGSSDIEASEIAQISHYLEGLSKRLSIYTESYTIGQALGNLSQDISGHPERFQEVAKELSTLSAAFVSDLQGWFKMTFYEGAPSVNFMDDTIVANSKMIASMLIAEDTTDAAADIDDIFDF